MRTMIFVLMLVSLAIANEPKVVQVPKGFKGALIKTLGGACKDRKKFKCRRFISYL